MNISRTIFRRVFIFMQLILIAFVLVSTITAQSSSVDLSFNAVITRGINGGNFTLQPDGKILTFGNFQVVNGVINNGIARINPDGSLDNSFNCTTCNFRISSAILQPDGKIIVAGNTDTANSSAVIYRLNADGSRDESFNSPFAAVSFPVNESASVQAILPDGKVLVVLSGSNSGFTSDILYRLNPDGTFDDTFNPITVGGGRIVRTVPTKISVTPSGKILVASFTSTAGNSTAALQRYNADGSPDSTFESPTFTAGVSGSSVSSVINDFEVLADESIIIVGNFNAVNAISRVNIAKLQPAGNVDLSFAPPNVFQNGEPATGVEVYSNGSILVSTGTVNLFTAPPGTTNRFIRYNADGSVDNTFTSPSDLVLINNFVIDSSDSVLVYEKFVDSNNTAIDRFSRLNTDGSIASSFTVDFGIGGSVKTLAIQQDGQILIAGDFSRVNGVLRNGIARLNSDGSLDPSFDPGTGFNGTIEKVLVQTDGKILVGGGFTGYNGVEKIALLRLNPNGSLDTTFDANILGGTVLTIALQPDTLTDSKILIGGSFSAVGGLTRNGFARINFNGSLDSGFNPTFGNPQFQTVTIRSILVQENGKFVVGGSFNAVNGFSRSNLVRFNADDTLDTSFNAESISPVLMVEIYPGGKYLITSFSGFARLNNDGTIDNSFQPLMPNGTINAILVQPDGSIIIGGDFTILGTIPRSRLARLRANGNVDTSFFPVGANDVVRVIARQSDGRIVIGGDFTMIANVTRLAVARLIVGPVRTQITQFDFDGDGKADLSVFRPSNGFWYELLSQNNSFYALQFGQSSDLLAPADYDGDGRTDIAVFRENVPGAGDKSYFYITNSSDNAFRFAQFGTQGDLPMSGDWDGDGIADLAVYREAEAAGGQSFFFYRPSSAPGVDFRTIAWGTSGDKPVMGDFDGDGKLDAAVVRVSMATWYILQSSNGQIIQQPFGLPTDIPTPADYDGDGKTNIAVFRPSTGFWFTSTNPQTNFGAVQFGAMGDLPVPADYDGDGRADIAVYRPSNGVWYLLRSQAGFTGVQFGAAEDRPIPNVYIR